MSSRLPDDIAVRARAAARSLVESLDRGVAVVFATVDGFDIAHAGDREIDAARLAAMVSSFAALGDAASRETGIGDSRCLVVESTGGRLVVRCMNVQGESIIVVVLTDTKMLLGMVWNQLATVERQLNA